MITFKKYSDKQNYNLLDLYLFLSFSVSFLLWCARYISYGNIYDVGLLPSVLLLGSYFYFQNGLGQTQCFSKTPYLPALFVFQIVCCLGVGSSISSAYLALVPCLSGIFYFNYNEVSDDERRDERSFALLGITAAAFVLMSSLTKWAYEVESLITFSCVIIWATGMILWAKEFMVQREKSTLFKLLKKSRNKKIIGNLEYSDKERFFFHDLINQTHGMLLFLSLKQEKGISSDESKSLMEELRVIQSLIQDHFGYKHKNLDTNKAVISFDSAKVGLINLVDSFLPADKVNCHFLFEGEISDSTPYETRKSCLVHYPSFHRILNNIVKNLAEAQINEVEMLFNYSNEGLSITVKNKAFRLKDSKRDLADNLRQMILKNDDPQSGQGLGLESIGSLCESLGGAFNFQVEGEFWVSHIFLPRPDKDFSQEKFAA